MSTATSTAADTRSDAIDAWAQRLAETMPPFTPDEIADLGRIVAGLDAQRAAERGKR